jgi:hypothetical protein
MGSWLDGDMRPAHYLMHKCPHELTRELCMQREPWLLRHGTGDRAGISAATNAMYCTHRPDSNGLTCTLRRQVARLYACHVIVERTHGDHHHFFSEWVRQPAARARLGPTDSLTAVGRY